MKINFTLHKNKKPGDIKNFSYTSINPYRDWYLMIGIFFCLNIIGAIFSAYIFYMSQNHVAPPGIQAPVNQDEQIISRLHKVVSEYELKKQQYQETINNKSAVSDPSL